MSSLLECESNGDGYMNAIRQAHKNEVGRSGNAPADLDPTYVISSN